MKKLLILTSFILCAAYGFAQTTIIGGAGVIAGRNNPNSLTALDYQDPRYEGLLYNDTLTGILYRHDNSLAFGSRWVSMASISEVDGSVTNEGVLGVGAGGANTAVALSTTSGATGITIDGGTAKGISVTESTSANGGTITLGLGVLTAYANDAAAATGGLAVGDWYKASSDNTMGMAAGTPKIRAF